MQTLYGIRFIPIARIDGMWLGLDARWLRATGWGPLLLLGVLAVATAPGALAGAEPGTCCLAGLLMVSALLLTCIGHELGHVVASRVAGLSVRAMVIAPQGGATVHSASDLPHQDLLAALGGPLANTLLGAICLAMFSCVDGGSYLSRFFLELGALQLVTAVVNLLPWSPMDGRRILAACRGLGGSARAEGLA